MDQIGSPIYAEVIKPPNILILFYFSYI